MKSLDPAPTAAAAVHLSAFDAAMLRMKTGSNRHGCEASDDDDDGVSDASDTSDLRLRSFPLMSNEYSSSSMIGAGDSTMSIRSSDGGLS